LHGFSARTGRQSVSAAIRAGCEEKSGIRLDVRYRGYDNTGVTWLGGKVPTMKAKEHGASPEAGERMIHIRLKAETHRRLRVHVAELDRSIQDWVANLIEEELDSVEASKVGRTRLG